MDIDPAIIMTPQIAGHADLVAFADGQALSLVGEPFVIALELLDAGAFAGSAAEAELRMLRFLLED